MKDLYSDQDAQRQVQGCEWFDIDEGHNGANADGDVVIDSTHIASYTHQCNALDNPEGDDISESGDELGDQPQQPV